MDVSKKNVFLAILFITIAIASYWFGGTRTVDDGSQAKIVIAKLDEVLANYRKLETKLDRAAKESAELTARIGDLEKVNNRIESQIGELGASIGASDRLLEELRVLDREREQIIRDLLEGTKGNTKTP